MKRTLLMALLSILSYGAFAQAGSLTVVNSSNCTVYYIIRGDKMGTCGRAVVSSFITLPPGATVVYPNSAAIPGFPASPLLWITLAEIYQRPLGCGTSPSSAIGEPCTGLPLLIHYPVFSASCSICNPNETAQWTPALGAGGPATLKFF